MVPVLNRPVMEHILRLLARHGFTETIANLHWFPDLITDHFGDGSACGVSLTYSREEALLGTSGGVRNVADFLGDDFLIISGDALTDIDLTAMREFHEGPAPGTSKAAKPGDPDGFADWAMDVFPRLLESDVPFYSHEIDSYWNDIGNLVELREGTYDALSGAVQVEQVGEMVDGFRSGEPEDGEPGLEGPVLLGPDCEIGDDVRIDGPAVIGDGAHIGAGSRLRDVIVLPGATVPERSILIGAILGARA
jgi:mannose-1-phosphate guanylyltransferase/mannose-1-phosphate guanylyltransferase/phosphomannomutase